MILCSFYPAAPSPPENVHVTKTTKDSVTIDWKPPSDNGGSKVRRYHIWLSVEESDDWKKIETVDSYKTSTVVTKLDYNTKYLIGVSAENDVGISERSEIAKAVVIEKPLGLLFCCFFLIFVIYFIVHSVSFFLSVNYQFEITDCHNAKVMF